MELIKDLNLVGLEHESIGLLFWHFRKVIILIKSFCKQVAAMRPEIIAADEHVNILIRKD